MSRNGVGIVVPTRRLDGVTVDESALRATLQSLCDQSHEDFEVVVVRAGDEPPVVADVRDPRIRSIEVDGRDPLGMLEEGLGRVDARWIRFLPAGDTLAPQTLAAESVALEDAPDVSAVFVAVERVLDDGAIHVATAVPQAGRFEAGALLAELVARNPWPLAAARIERDTLFAVGGLDRALPARVDHDLWWRLFAGRSVLLEPRVHARVRGLEAPVGDDDHVRLLLRHLRGDLLEFVVFALGGGARDSAAQGIARAELARRLRALERVELRPLVWKLVRESRGAGAYFPADPPFEELARLAPELARADGWFVPATAEVQSTPRSLEPAGSFPPRVLVALATDDGGARERVARMVSNLDVARARALGLDLLVLHAGTEPPPPVPKDIPVEILRHVGSAGEIEGVFRRRSVSLVVAESDHLAVETAERCGIAVRSDWPTGPLVDVVRALHRASAATAANAGRSLRAAERQRRAGKVGRARDAATLGALARSLARASAHVGRSVDHELTDRLAEAQRQAEAARRAARAVERDTRRTLDKLRIGRRIRETLGRGSSPAARGDSVVSLDLPRAERFLIEAASKDTHRLWVIYTTDAYSETQGQRSTWIARELLSRGDSVVFFYWRWELSEAIAPSPHPRLLSVPIDQFFRLQRPLMDLAAPGLEKLFLVEFPDAYLYEQIDFANAHGFTTIYDCVDDWEEFARAGQAHWYDPGVERHLVRYADVVVATHPVLAARLEAMGRPVGTIDVVPNGVALDSLEGAPSRTRTGPPVIGYFGHLTPAWFDWELIEETARAHPDWKFDILGHGAPGDLDLPANVNVPGPVPHESLEARTRGWHVGIVPFRPGRLTQAVDPIKLYEYLALGLPAVVVDMPHLEGTPEVEVAERGGFARAIERALSRPFDAAAASAFVEASRWSVRTDALCAAVPSTGRVDLLKAL